MWSAHSWFLLLQVCSADPAVGCMETAIRGFQKQDLCEAALQPVASLLGHVKPDDLEVRVVAECVAVEVREA